MDVDMTSVDNTVILGGSKPKGKKKKSALAKLAEKRKHSDGGSEFGSAVSLQKVAVDDAPKVINKTSEESKAADGKDGHTRFDQNLFDSSNVFLDGPPVVVSNVDGSKTSAKYVTSQNSLQVDKKDDVKKDVDILGKVGSEGDLISGVNKPYVEEAKTEIKSDVKPETAKATPPKVKPRRRLLSRERDEKDKESKDSQKVSENNSVEEVNKNRLVDSANTVEIKPLGGLSYLSTGKSRGGLSPLGSSSKPKSPPLPALPVKAQNEELSTLEPMDIDDNSDENKEKGDNDTISNKAPSDATLHRFRALKMAPERRSSVESLKNSPFVPKPPTTPRSGRKTSAKGEKRNREPNSSGEEADADTKRTSSDTRLNSETKVDNNSDKFGDLAVETSGINQITSSSDHKSEKLDKNRSSKSSKKKGGKSEKLELKRGGKMSSTGDTNREAEMDTTDSPGKQSVDTVGSASDLHAISDNYAKVLQETPHTGDLSSTSDSVPRDLNVTNSSKEGAKLPPGFGRLAPLSPKTHPPPLSQDMMSASLRTMYKSDPAYKNISKPFIRSVSGGTERKALDNISQHSFTSTSVVPLVTTKEARQRTKHSSLGSTLLSEAELERHFPEKKVRVWVGTWNMAEIKEVSNPMDDFFLPECSDYMQDIYAIGTQENNMNKKEWEIAIQEILGASHVLFHSATHGALHLAVFLKRDLIWVCSVPEDDLVQTRAVTMVKTKGCVAISFSLFGTSFIFINCHFAAGDGKKKDRLGDIKKIIRELKLPKSVNSSPPSATQGTSDVTTRFDCLYWMGDLNFRIEVYKGRQAVEDLVMSIQDQEHPNFEALLQSDQLLKLIDEDTIFQGFHEGRINFKPTYKFDIGKETYDTSVKNRVPSYTDRILFRAKKKNTISCLFYDSPTTVRDSDHHPVFGIYEAVVKPGKDSNVPLAVGQFDRIVYTEANKRRAMKVKVVEKLQSKGKSSTVCSIQ